MIGNLIPYGIMLVTAGCALWREAPYATLPFLGFMCLWYTIRMILTRGDDKPVVDEKGARRERSLVILVGIGMVYVPIAVLAAPILDFAAYEALPGQIALGFLVGLLGAYIFWRSHADLGKNWSPHLELREGHHLVTGGIYAWMRHPMYTAIFLITGAQMLMLTNWIAGPLGLATFILLYLARIGAEEEMMRESFAEEWEVYAANTPRLLPRRMR